QPEEVLHLVGVGDLRQRDVVLRDSAALAADRARRAAVVGDQRVIADLPGGHVEAGRVAAGVAGEGEVPVDVGEHLAGGQVRAEVVELLVVAGAERGGQWVGVRRVVRVGVHDRGHLAAGRGAVVGVVPVQEVTVDGGREDLLRGQGRPAGAGRRVPARRRGRDAGRGEHGDDRQDSGRPAPDPPGTPPAAATPRGGRGGGPGGTGAGHGRVSGPSRRAGYR